MFHLAYWQASGTRMVKKQCAFPSNTNMLAWQQWVQTIAMLIVCVYYDSVMKWVGVEEVAQSTQALSLIREPQWHQQPPSSANVSTKHRTTEGGVTVTPGSLFRRRYVCDSSFACVCGFYRFVYVFIRLKKLTELLEHSKLAANISQLVSKSCRAVTVVWFTTCIVLVYMTEKTYITCSYVSWCTRK